LATASPAMPAPMMTARMFTLPFAFATRQNTLRDQSVPEETGG
jgi:hypothetical protein